MRILGLFLISLLMFVPCLWALDAEDFTTYTEVDANSEITINSSVLITLNDFERDAESYVYKDKGAGTIGDLDAEIQVDPSASSSNFSSTLFFGSSSTVETRDDWGEGYYLVMRRTGSAGQNPVDLVDVSLGTLDTSTNLDDSDHWFQIDVTGTTATIEIHGNSSFTDLEDTITGTITSGTFRYTYVVSANDTEGAGPDWHGTIENFSMTLAAGGATFVPKIQIIKNEEMFDIPNPDDWLYATVSIRADKTI